MFAFIAPSRRRGPRQPAEDDLCCGLHVTRDMTIREIGQAAFLAPRTVEHVLGGVYQKLGVTSRTQLVALLAAGEGDHRSNARTSVEP